MDYDWDEGKRRANRLKHGVDFTAVYDFEWETAVIEFDDRHDEPRWVARGFIGGALHVAVFTERDGEIRIIILRKANAREKRDYAENRPH